MNQAILPKVPISSTSGGFGLVGINEGPSLLSSKKKKKISTHLANTNRIGVDLIIYYSQNSGLNGNGNIKLTS